MPKLETERLILKQINESDKEYFYQLMGDTEVIKYCFDSPDDDAISDMFYSRIPSWYANSKHWLCLSVVEKSESQFVGLTGFKTSQENAEIGYMFLPKYFGMGYATESLLALVKYAKSVGIQCLIANITEGNIASVRVVEKCGFKLKNISSGAISIAGKMHSNLHYVNSI